MPLYHARVCEQSSKTDKNIGKKWAGRGQSVVRGSTSAVIYRYNASHHDHDRHDRSYAVKHSKRDAGAGEEIIHGLA
jgi:hypothetical protein